MKFTVVGHICKDFIHPKKNGKAENIEPLWGGIFFAVATLANITSSDDKIFPVFPIGEDDYDAIIERLKHYPNVDTDGIYKIKGETNSVHLLYSTAQTRSECSKNIAPSIPLKKIQPYLKTDGLLLNMVSGFDISLETLYNIRLAIREQDVISHIDLHSLTLGINDDFTRFRTPLIEWRQWAFMMNTVQMNQEEAKSLTVERYSEEMLAKQLLSVEVQQCIITKGAKGVSLFVAEEHKHISQHTIPPAEKIKTIDATGCGDVFSAAFLYQFVKSKNPVASAEFANLIAAINTQYIGSSEIDTITNAQLETEHTPL
ncbi:MAG: carbohydrate kinase family protein [Ignavibacteria bacterium]|nr:carbohydrate kinase family protein [Ignavibacteria bacterium]